MHKIHKYKTFTQLLQILNKLSVLHLLEAQSGRRSERRSRAKAGQTPGFGGAWWLQGSPRGLVTRTWCTRGQMRQSVVRVSAALHARLGVSGGSGRMGGQLAAEAGERPVRMMMMMMISSLTGYQGCSFKQRLTVWQTARGLYNWGGVVCVCLVRRSSQFCRSRWLLQATCIRSHWPPARRRAQKKKTLINRKKHK